MGVSGGGSGGISGTPTTAALEMSNVTETRSGKVRGNLPLKGRRGANSNASSPSNFATPNSPQNSANNKRKGREADIQSNDNKNKRSRVCGNRQTNGTEDSPERAVSAPVDETPVTAATNAIPTTTNTTTTTVAAQSPQLIECPEPNCSKKYKHINGLKYHQSHAHNGADGADASASNPESDDNSTMDTRPEDGRKGIAECNSSNDSEPASDLVKSTVLRYPGQAGQNANTSVTSNTNITTNSTTLSSTISSNGTPKVQNISQQQHQQQLPPSPQQLPPQQQQKSQQQQPIPPQQLSTQQQSQIPTHQQQQQQTVPQHHQQQQPQPPGHCPTTPQQQSIYHSSIQQQPPPPSNQAYSPVPGPPYQAANGTYPPPAPTPTSQPSHSPLSTLSPQQLQALQCPPSISDNAHGGSPSVIARLPPPPPSHQMYVYPPNSGSSSPHRSSAPQTTSQCMTRPPPGGQSGPIRAVIQQNRQPNTQISNTPPTSVLSSASPRLAGPPITPHSTPLTSLPGSGPKNGSQKNGRDSGEEEDPRSPAYSDISDAADAPPVDSDATNGNQVDRRENTSKPDQMLLQPAPPPYVGLGVYGGFDGAYTGQSPFLLRYPAHSLAKPDCKDGKPGEDKKDSSEPVKFPSGQSPFPSGMYPYAAGLGPPPHYTSDPYYAHLAAAAHSVSGAPPPSPVGAPDGHPPKEGTASPNVSVPSDKAPSLPNAYRPQHPMDPRLLQPIIPGGLPLLPQVDKPMGPDGVSSGSTKDKQISDTSKTDSSNDSNKVPGREQMSPSTNASSFYQTPPGFPAAYAFEHYRAAAIAATIPSHFPTSSYNIPPQLRYPPITSAPEDLTRSSSSATSTPPPPSPQYAPHNLTPHKLTELHDRVSSNVHQSSPNKGASGPANKDSSKPSTPTSSVAPLPGLDGSKPPPGLPSHFSPSHYHQLLSSQYPSHHYAGTSSIASFIIPLNYFLYLT